MPSSFAVSTFLKDFKDAHATLDVRAALVSQKQQWLLVALSAHIRIDSAETAKNEFRRAINGYGEINSETFRILQRCYSVAEMESFFRNIAAGQLVLDNLTIGLNEQIDILSMIGFIRTWTINAQPVDWPHIECQRQIARNDLVTGLMANDREIVQTAEIAGYKDPSAAVRRLLEIDYSSSTQPGCMWLTCDVPVRLRTPDISRLGTELQCKLRVEAHSTVKNLSCIIRSTRTGNYGSEEAQQWKVELTHVPNGHTLEIWGGETKIAIDRSDRVTVDVVSDKVGILCSSYIRPFDHLPPQQRNPLFAALQLFCPLDQMALLLHEPHKAKVKLPSLSNAGKLFEISVQWLLSVLGFYAVWLHGYEKLRDAEMEYGTVDCLAYSEDEALLLLVGCSVTAPNVSEFGKHADLANRIAKQLYPDERVTVRSTIFTASPRSNGGHEKAYQSAIKIFYKEDIDELVQLAQSGQRLEYLRLSLFFNSNV